MHAICPILNEIGSKYEYTHRVFVVKKKIQVISNRYSSHIMHIIRNAYRDNYSKITDAFETCRTFPTHYPLYAGTVLILQRLRVWVVTTLTSNHGVSPVTTIHNYAPKSLIVKTHTGYDELNPNLKRFT